VQSTTGHNEHTQTKKKIKKNEDDRSQFKTDDNQYKRLAKTKLNAVNPNTVIGSPTIIPLAFDTGSTGHYLPTE
jgi:hypothetical protein